MQNNKKTNWPDYVAAITAIIALLFSGAQLRFYRQDFNFTNRPYLKLEITKFEDSNIYFKYFKNVNSNDVVLQISAKFSNFGNIPAANIGLVPFSFVAGGKSFAVKTDQALKPMIVYPADKQQFKLNLVLPTKNPDQLMKVFDAHLKANQLVLKFIYTALGNYKKKYWVKCEAVVLQNEATLLSLDGN